MTQEVITWAVVVNNNIGDIVGVLCWIIAFTFIYSVLKLAAKGD